MELSKNTEFVAIIENQKLLHKKMNRELLLKKKKSGSLITLPYGHRLGTEV